MVSKTNKIVAVVVVAIIVVAGAGVLLMDKGSDEPQIESFLPVYGNANNDFKISNDDVDIIQDIIDGKKSFSDFPLADANYDGKVDKADIDQTKGMINKTANKVWHINEIKDSQSVVTTKWPVTSSLATATMNVAVFFKMLDITDNIKGICYSKSSPPDPYLLPEFKDMEPISSYSEIDYDNASKYITEYGCTAIVTSTNPSYVKNWEDLENHNLDVIRIDATGTSIEDFLGSVLLLAFLFDANEKSEDICVFTEALLDDIEEKQKQIDKKVIAVASNTTGSIAAPTSDYSQLIEVAGGELLKDPRYTARVKMDSGEWLYDVQIDKIVSMRTGGGIGGSWYGGTLPDSGVKKVFDPFELMQSYKNNEAYIINGELPIPLRLAYTCEVLYPEIFGEGYADGYHQKWCDQIYGEGFVDISKIDTIFCVADYK